LLLLFFATGQKKDNQKKTRRLQKNAKNLLVMAKVYELTPIFSEKSELKHRKL